jgi:beta-galactosidase/beta-glucuronidase
VHPRPLLAREHWDDLNGEWEVRFDDEGRGLADGWWRPETRFERRITVPFPPESELSGVQEDGHPVVWYRHAATLPPPPQDGKVLLHFGAVDYRADVWVNGIHVGSHVGGHVGFHFYVTHALRPGAEQIITVRAFDDPRSLEQPRGKQDWQPEPHAIWYHRTTGIWRQVWAETVAGSHLSHVRWTPGARAGDLAVDIDIDIDGRGGADLELEIELQLEGEVLSRSRHSLVEGSLSASLSLRDPRFDTEPERLLWSPEHPTLIDAHLTLRRGRDVLDRVRSYVGLRTVAARGRRFLLNGRPHFLRLVLEQGYWPQSHLAAPSEDDLRREVQLVKDLGFNGIRMHQTVADPRFLYWCDRIGLLVWADAPAAYRFSSTALERTTSEWMEVLRRDASHPSIVAWVAFNESWGVPDLADDEQQRDAVKGLVGLLSALDPTRLVVGNDGWEYVDGNLLGIHDYTQSGEVLTARYGTVDAIRSAIAMDTPGGHGLTAQGVVPAYVPDVPVVLSEFGGIGYTTSDSAWPGYGTVDDEHAFVERLGSLLGAVNSSDGLAGFCYTQLTDTEQEMNGLTDSQRRTKAPVDVLRAIVLGTPAVKPRSGRREQ